MRKATVTYTFRNNDCIPMIRLRGKWLQGVGFKEGARVRITVSPGKLILTLDEVASDLCNGLSSGDSHYLNPT